MNIPILGYIWLMAFFIYRLWPALEPMQHPVMPQRLDVALLTHPSHPSAIRHRGR